MKRIIRIAAFLVLATVSNFVMAVEPVTGAFGIKLGDVLDDAKVLKRSVISSGVVKYEVKAISPHKSFQVYDVEITSGTRKIHAINGTARFPSRELAMKEFNAVKTEFEGKYGPAKTNRREGAAFFSSEQKSIALLVNQERESVVYLNVACKDADLAPLAEKEAIPEPAPEAIDGAFGIKFGEVFDLGKSTGVMTTTLGETLYGVRPPTPNPAFDRYFVEINPKTKTIFHVWAQGKVPSLAEGKIRQDALANTIEAKYQARRNIIDSEYARVLMQGQKMVTVKTYRMPDGGYVIDLKYIDNDMKADAKKEAVTIDSKNVNSKGL
jgi:hypothetical protein